MANAVHGPSGNSPDIPPNGSLNILNKVSPAVSAALALGMLFDVRYRHGSDWKKTILYIFEKHIDCPLTPDIEFKELQGIWINNLEKKKYRERAFGLKCRGIVFHFLAKNYEERDKVLLEIMSRFPKNTTNRAHCKTIQSVVVRYYFEIDHKGKERKRSKDKNAKRRGGGGSNDASNGAMISAQCTGGICSEKTKENHINVMLQDGDVTSDVEVNQKHHDFNQKHEQLQDLAKHLSRKGAELQTREGDLEMQRQQTEAERESVRKIAEELISYSGNSELKEQRKYVHEQRMRLKEELKAERATLNAARNQIEQQRESLKKKQKKFRRESRKTRVELLTLQNLLEQRKVKDDSANPKNSKMVISNEGGESEDGNTVDVGDQEESQEDMVGAQRMRDQLNIMAEDWKNLKRLF